MTSNETRTVFITGIAGGIGRATAAVFAAAGWRVVGCDLAAAMTSPHVHPTDYYQIDLAWADDVADLCRELSPRHPRLGAFVHLAAHQVCNAVEDTALSAWETVMAVNVRAAFLLTQGLLPSLRAAQGSIVNIASVHAAATSANIAAYAASKGALVSLTRALAVELAPTVRVNAVLPGAVDTPMLHAGLQRGEAVNTNAGLAALGQRTVLGRVGQPSEIAQAIMFLADNRLSSFMTGQTLTVDGGATACLSTEAGFGNRTLTDNGLLAADSRKDKLLSA